MELGFLPVPNITTPALRVNSLSPCFRCTVKLPSSFFSILRAANH